MMSQSSSAVEAQATARPFIKWAGGKSQLLPELSRRLPRHFQRYHEPFVGGAALFFYLYNEGLLKKGAVLSDYNRELILCYRVVRDNVEQLIELLQEHAVHRSDSEYFLQIRKWDRQPGFEKRSEVERAARTIFLNRTCYNGLYRLNNKGQFNAPFGYYKNPLICDADNLRAVSKALEPVELHVSDFWKVIERAQPGDLVYFDPPYDPVSSTASFTHYTGQSFGPDDHRRLAKLFTTLKQQGVYVMLSNSYTPLTCELYAEHTEKSTVLASRKINCDGRKRGSVKELIVCGYQVESIV
ncbi:MAG: DNA adenine methylase [Chloroflexota bacterium]